MDEHFLKEIKIKIQILEIKNLFYTIYFHS